MTHGTATKKPIAVDWWLWDGKAETADRINEWAHGAFGDKYKAPWFDTVTRAQSHQIYGEPDYTAEVWDYKHSRWIPLRTGDRVMKGIDGECYPCAGDVFVRTYDVITTNVDTESKV